MRNVKRLLKMDLKGLVLLCTLIAPVFGAQELKLVHVIFAHKLYAPIADSLKDNETSLPANLTYEYFNARTLDMSNAAKLNMYNLGMFLRKRYDKFMGDVYMPEKMKMRTTEFPLSMMSGQLVNAALWPPRDEQRWTEGMEWQPVPSDYEPVRKDTLLLGMLCPNFQREIKKVLRMKKYHNRIIHHEPLFKHISVHTQRNVSLPSDVALIYSSLEMQEDQGILLPVWADGIFPDGEMYNVTLLEYDILSETLLQKQLHGGPLLKEILANSMNYVQGNLAKERKMMLYSGDERNLVAIFKNIDLWSSPHIPREASALLFELHFDNETDIYGLKIIYHTGVDEDTIPLIIPGCEEICPIDKFKYKVFDLIPTNEQSLCGWTTPLSLTEERLPSDKDTNDSSSGREFDIFPLAILFIFTQYIMQ